MTDPKVSVIVPVYNTERYLRRCLDSLLHQTLAELDVLVGRLVEALKKAGIYDDTIIIVTADHGGKEKGHGGKTLLEMEHPFIICGKGIRQGMVIAEPMMQYDTAATIAHIFALPTPYSWVGHPLLSVFK